MDAAAGIGSVNHQYIQPRYKSFYVETYKMVNLIIIQILQYIIQHNVVRVYIGFFTLLIFPSLLILFIERPYLYYTDGS